MGGIGISRKPCISISEEGLSVDAGEIGAVFALQDPSSGDGKSVETGETAAGLVLPVERQEVGGR